jgi:hypothetical protein
MIISYSNLLFFLFKFFKQQDVSKFVLVFTSVRYLQYTHLVFSHLEYELY